MLEEKGIYLAAGSRLIAYPARDKDGVAVSDDSDDSDADGFLSV